MKVLSGTKKIYWLCAASVIVMAVAVVIWMFVIKPAKTTKGVIVTNGYGCSDIGTKMFEKGGSAADAAIAALFCEGVSMPFSMGLGGGFLLTIYDKQNKMVKSLDAREMAPQNANSTMYNGNGTLSQKGGLAVAVPGEVRGYYMLHQEFGYLNWSELIQPTIDLCRNGIYVTAYHAKNFLVMTDLLKADPVLREIFIDETTGYPYVEGQYVKRLQLAKTLEIIQTEPDALYSGTLVKGFVQDVQDKGGIITVEDMKNYTPVWQDSLTTTLSTEHKVFTTPLPGSGTILIFILNILDGFLNLSEPFSTETFQRTIEAFKFGYGKRTELGDPPFVEGIQDLVNNLTSKSYAQEIRTKISDKQTSNDPTFYGAKATTMRDHGTAHVSVLAPNGDAISVTSTINLIFGAGFGSKSTGIILNDEMDDFSAPNITNQFNLPPSEANFIQPHKRPLSSMVPTIILEGDDVVLITGAAGGTKITTVVAEVIIKHLWYNINLNDAITQKRVHHQLFPMRVEYEEGFNETYPDVVKALATYGHNYTFTPTSYGFSAVTSITTKDGYLGAFDNRRGGYISYYQE